MLTGTPLDLTPFGPLLTVMGLLYWAIAIGAAVLALRWPKSPGLKALWLAVVAAVFLYPVLTRNVEQHAPAGNAKARLDESMAVFADRCKRAGETILRTVENVDGVVWMKWREKYGNEDNFADQWKLNDPYGRDCGLEDCIGNLLRVSEGASLNPDEAKRHSRGYRFVETVDPVDGKPYRYTAHLEHGWSQEAVERHRKATGKEVPSFSYHFKIARLPIAKVSAQYGVLWDDISTREEREHWIAASSLKVVDLQTNETLGERVGFMIDRGQGSQAGLRSPWLAAFDSACPEFARSESRSPIVSSRSRDFVRKVLHPSQGE